MLNSMLQSFLPPGVTIEQLTETAKQFGERAIALDERTKVIKANQETIINQNQRIITLLEERGLSNVNGTGAS